MGIYHGHNKRRPKLKYHSRESAQKEVAKYRDLYKDLTVDNWRELLSHDEDEWDNMEREEWKVLEEQVHTSPASCITKILSHRRLSFDLITVRTDRPLYFVIF